MRITGVGSSSRGLLDQMKVSLVDFARSSFIVRERRHSLFLVFPKKNKDNIKIDEVRWFKKMAKSTFALSEDQLEKLIKTGDFRPVKCYE